MGARDNLQRLIDRKQQEIKGLESKIKEANVYLQALQDAMRSLPRDVQGSSSEPELRSGTSISKSRDAIRSAGKPLHINDLLVAIGKAPNKGNRLSLAGTLGGYVRKGQIFKRTGPNTFGLIEFPNGADSASAETPIEEELPEAFGT